MFWGFLWAFLQVWWLICKASRPWISNTTQNPLALFWVIFFCTVLENNCNGKPKVQRIRAGVSEIEQHVWGYSERKVRKGVVKIIVMESKRKIMEWGRKEWRLTVRILLPRGDEGKNEGWVWGPNGVVERVMEGSGMTESYRVSVGSLWL